MAMAVVCGLWAHADSQATTVSVAPGSLFGYLPLSAFGVTPIAGVTDDSLFNSVLPSFSYTGQTWNSVGFSSNGYLVVGGANVADNTALNQALPQAGAPNNVLAPFWTNLNPELGGEMRVGVLTDGVSNWAVFDWSNVENADNSGTNSFQAWIGLNGVEDITFAYDGVTAGSGGLLTIGAEDATGTVGGMWHYNGTGGVVGTDLRVTTSVSAIPEPSTYAFMLAGLVFIGGAVRRSRRASR
jgi:hypothetical protein